MKKTPKPINPDCLPELIDDDEGFARFDEMTKRLMRVPKSEIDERQSEYELQPKTSRDERRNKIIPPR